MTSRALLGVSWELHAYGDLLTQQDLPNAGEQNGR